MNASIELAQPQDDEGVRRLARSQVMPGRVRLSYCREPEFSIGCAITGSDHQILIARSEEGEIVGVACRSVRRVFLNGLEQRIGYLGQLRIDERYRGRWLVSRGFAMLEQLHRADPLPAYLASIVDGNREATGVLVEKPRRRTPSFRETARYLTLAIWIGRAKPVAVQGVEIVAGSDDQLDEVARFLGHEGPRRQLSSVWTADALRDLQQFGLNPSDIRIARRQGAIAGVLALWDQSAFKQSIVRGYTGWLRPVAPILPRPGTQLRSAYAALACVADDDAAVFDGLLRDIYNLAQVRGVRHLLVGFDSRDPLLGAARRYRHLVYPSRLYLATFANQPCGGLGREPLDARPTYVDIATL